MSSVLKKQSILGLNVDVISLDKLLENITIWARNFESKFVAFANVHMVMEAYDNQELSYIINSADIISPDGMPLVWYIKLMSDKKQERLSGPESMIKICEIAERENLKVGLFGGKEENLLILKKNLLKMFPKLKLVYCESPPFRELTLEEETSYISEISNKKVQILFVGLGCPKQEKWIYRHKGKLKCVMLGVGAAFDYHSGVIKKPPQWVQKMGFEWFFRLLQEPKRLWKRYLYNNPRFLFLVLIQIIKVFKKNRRDR